MNRKLVTTTLIVLLVLLLSVGGVSGQATEPGGEGRAEGETSVAATVQSRISYQGVLKESGNPVTGSRDMIFRLYSDDACSTQVGSDIVENGVSVTDGLFSTELDVNQGYFNGRGLWLEIEVGGTAVGCQEILPVPYALSLRPGARVIGEQVGWDGIHVVNTATGGPSYGVYGKSYSTSGRGVSGYASAGSGTTYGVRGESSSTSGTGVYGYAYRSSGTTYGVYGQSESPDGFGVYGENTSGGSGVYGTSSSGHGVYGYTASIYDSGVVGLQTGSSTADLGSYWDPGGFFGGRNGVFGISNTDGGYGVAGWNKATTGYRSIGVYGKTDSSNGWAGYFTTNAGNGVYISTPSGNTGLNVAGGTKNAVVATDEGSKLLYSEESTEVWFTDYGFGQLEDGVAVIAIDEVFAQTVNLDEPYHVFVQVYGDAEVYVSNRTATSFEVHLRDGDPAVEFSYRIVAKRLGYEGDRLESAPWANGDPHLYPEKQDALVAQGGSE